MTFFDQIGAELAGILHSALGKGGVTPISQPDLPLQETPKDFILIDGQKVPLVFRRHARARRYVLRLRPDRTVAVTVPWRGSMQFAREFVASRQTWLEKQWRNLQARNVPPAVLRPGMPILFRGSMIPLSMEQAGDTCRLQLGGDIFPVKQPNGDLRPDLEAGLRKLAERELAQRVKEMAVLFSSPVRLISIRNQKSRWGSCSRRGTISLNWRLIQAPASVRDYIIVHELMHFRELNHSRRFWAEVERACPDYRQCELWLRKNSRNFVF